MERKEPLYNHDLSEHSPGDGEEERRMRDSWEEEEGCAYVNSEAQRGAPSHSRDIKWRFP